MHNNENDLFNRLFSRTIICENGCWEFTGGRFSKGYGMITYKRKTLKAHRVAYDLVVGDIPEGIHVLHHCDNPSCCNPEHLFLGTSQDNVDDCIAKDRRANARGSDIGNSILDDKSVLEIWRLLNESNLSQREIGSRYNVSQALISAIKNGQRWKHVLTVMDSNYA